MKDDHTIIQCLTNKNKAGNDQWDYHSEPERHIQLAPLIISFLKIPDTAKIRHFSPHPHTIIRYPQSQTLSTLQYHPLIFIRSLTQQNTARSLQVHRNRTHSYTTSLSNPTKAKLRTAQAPLNHSRTRNKVQKHGHTQEEKGLTINEQCTTIATTLGKEIVTEKPPVTPQRDLGHETSVTHLPEPVTNIQQTLDHNHTNCYKP